MTALVVANVSVAALGFIEPLLFGRVIALLGAANDRADVWGRLAGLLTAWAACGGTAIAAAGGVALLAERLAHRARLDAMARCFGHVLALPPAFHDASHSGRTMKTMLSGADGIGWVLLNLGREQIATSVALLLLLPLTLLLNWRLALVLIVLVSAYAVTASLVVRRTEAGQRRAQEWQVALAERAQDTLANVTLVQSFGTLHAETGHFAELVGHVIRAQFPVLAWWAAVSVATRAASTVATIVIVVSGVALHRAGQAGVAEIVSFMGFAALLIARLDGAVQFASRIAAERPNLLAFAKLMATPPALPERGHAPHLQPDPRGERGGVSFEDVWFAYPGGVPALAGVNFTASPGAVVALVGTTGAGKSTAMALLQRFRDPDRGRILINGQDLRDVRLDSVRAAIGTVFQDAGLFNRTIRENLLIGRPRATEAELRAACTLAHAMEFVERLPEGFDTVVGERGVLLSGGQRQRLAIARAALKDPAILILDEATSALDAATEASVALALRALTRGRTTFVVAHRLSTVRDADVILVFEGGRIVEQGGFSELLQRRGAFVNLVRSQLTPA